MMGYEFEVVPSPADESAVLPDAFQTYGDFALRKALVKGRAVAAAHPDAVVIGCDTVVACNGRLYEKPRNEEELLGFLRDFSENVQVVYTAVTVFAPGVVPREPEGPQSEVAGAGPEVEELGPRPYYSHVEATEVRFGVIPEEEARAYARTSEPYDKAGGYAMQGQAGGWITHINGDYYTVVGFPLNKVCCVLRELGAKREFR